MIHSLILPDRYRSQYSLFALLAAPLVFSADIRGTDPAGKNNWTAELASILLNREVIAVSQDPLGLQGRLVKQLSPSLQLYVRQLMGKSLAVGVFNRDDATNATGVDVRWADVGVAAGSKVTAVRDLWAGNDLAFTDDGVVLAQVDTHDTAVLRVETA